MEIIVEHLHMEIIIYLLDMEIIINFKREVPAQFP